MRDELLREDLPSRAAIAQACRLDHRHPEDIALRRTRITCTHTRLDQQRLRGGAVAPLKALLNQDRTRDRRGGALKRHHEPIPRVLHLPAPSLADNLAQQPEMLLPQVLGNYRPDSRLKLR